MVEGRQYTGGMSRILAVALTAAVLVPVVAQSPALDRDGERWVTQTLQKMTLDEKIGQMLVPGFEPTYLASDTEVFERLAGFVRNQHVGGFITSGGRQPASEALLNPGYSSVVPSQPLAAAATFNRLQSLSTIPLLNSSDFESGVGIRFAGATSFPNAMAFGATGDDRLSAEAARIIATEGRAIGVHVNIGPVADVNSNARNPVMTTSAFGETPAAVSAMVTSYVRSLQQHGMLAALKHFPGHGDTTVGAPVALPVLPHPRARLDALELSPFRAGIDAGAAAVMTSHIVVPALDPQPHTPVTFSPAATTALLRSQKAIEKLMKNLEGDLRTGAAIIRRACEEPVRMIAANAGHEGAVIVDKIRSNSDPNVGFNADEERREDMVASGVIDPTKVVRVALQNAASIAGLLLTTDVCITDAPEKKRAMPAMPEGGGGGYGDFD